MTTRASRVALCHVPSRCLDGLAGESVNPRTKETFVLIRADEYKRLKDEEYDDSPWTRDELQILAWEAGKQAGWEDMDEYEITETDTKPGQRR